MSYGILKFKLPEENDDFESAQNGWKYKDQVEQIFTYLRKREKYEDLPEDAVRLIEDLRKWFNDEYR